MSSTAPVQTELTRGQAQAVYHRTTDKIRERLGRVMPRVGEATQPWDVATAQVVMNLAEWEAVAVLRYLMTQVGLARPDVVLANALAARLGLSITFTERKELS